MKLIKIGAIWCSGCLVMNKVWNKLIKEYNFSYETYDIDMDEDEVEKYNVGEPPLLLRDAARLHRAGHLHEGRKGRQATRALQERLQVRCSRGFGARQGI